MIGAVPFFDLAAQHAALAPELSDAVLGVVASGRCVLGEPVERFERELGTLCGGTAVGLSNGSDALMLLLQAIGVGPGDAVLTTPFTFFATAGAVARLGARPVFADVDPATWNLSPESAARTFGTERPRAAVAVHLFGRLADMGGLRAALPGIPLLEDAAHALGARDAAGRPAGSLGDGAAFSFYPTKNLGAAGDAGAVVVGDPGVADRIRRLRNHGALRKGEHLEAGGNFRLDAVQAAVLSAKLPHLPRWLAARERLAERYRQALCGTDFVLPAPGAQVWNQFCVLHPRRDALASHLARRGIGHEIYYPRPLHLQPCFASLGGAPGDFPVAEDLSRRILALPLYPELPEPHLARILDALLSFDRGGAR